MKTLRLGLIGDNITESRSPALQIVCGLSAGRNVSYDLLIPSEQGLSFADLLKHCAALGFDGVNVTYPYKEEVLEHVPAGDSLVAAIGAANTVKFDGGGATAWNTDHSGFIAAYRGRLPAAAPGRVLLIGAGGVGRAIAFALAKLGAEDIQIYDTDIAKATALVASLGGRAGWEVSRVDHIRLETLDGYNGVVNATPLGMAGKEGSPLPLGAKGKPRWAFDAVYTPEYTTFRGEVEALGAEFLSGYELYLHQGVQGFRIFSGADAPDIERIRAQLALRP